MNNVNNVLTYLTTLWEVNRKKGKVCERNNFNRLSIICTDTTFEKRADEQIVADQVEKQVVQLRVIYANDLSFAVLLRKYFKMISDTKKCHF